MEKKVKTGDFVVPGDFLATSEEFVPSAGAYEKEGEIYSSCTGVVLMDVREKKVSVHAKTNVPPSLDRGDIVVGRVEEIKGQVANVAVGFMRGREDRQLPPTGDAVVHISKIRDRYVEEVGQEFKPGDIVRARLLNVERGSMKLSTVDDNLGVLVALCSECRTVMDKENSKLKCPNCGKVESRKIASDYRQGIL